MVCPGRWKPAFSSNSWSRRHHALSGVNNKPSTDTKINWGQSLRRLRTMVRMARAHTSGQHALSCTTVEPGQLDAALWRLRNCGAAESGAATLHPRRGLGLAVSRRLALWQLDVVGAFLAASSSSQERHSCPASGAGGAAGGGKTPASRLAELAAAYPEFEELLPEVDRQWAAGATRVHLVPLEAMNPLGGAPQVESQALFYVFLKAF